MPPGRCFEAHLHVMSGFSYGFGSATPEELAETAAQMGYGSLALTDHDGLYGIPRFLAACEKTGLCPIVGARITVQLGKQPESKKKRAHLVLLAESMQGYRSLCKLITSYRLRSRDTPKERRNPACSLEELAAHSAGLICLTGAVPFGLGYTLASPDTGLSGKKREEVISLLSEAFGKRLYVELSDDATMGSRRRMAAVESLADRYSLPTVATGEVCYLHPEDHRLHEVLVAASNLTRLPGPGYRPTDRLYFRGPSRMSRIFADRPQALRNIRQIAERCAGAVKLSGKVLLPTANLPAGEDPTKKLYALSLSGARRRYPASFRDDPEAFPTKQEIGRRLRREIACIDSLGFAGYFLIAKEAVVIARERNLPVTGRGSAANSLVCYCLGLTQPDPFAHRLLFERFLHEFRRYDPPDIDLDFDSERRDEVRDELIGRYERCGAAVACTANTLSLRGAVRVASRALGYSPKEIDGLARGVPTRIRDRDKLVRYASRWDAALENPAMRSSPLQDRKRYALLLDISEKLEGKLWQAGTHLGGVVLGTSERHLSELVPLEASGKPNLIRTQYDKDGLEYAGIPKLDLLGLRMHTAMRKAGELVSKKLGKSFDPLSPPENDRATHRLIRSGHTAGVFQLESPGQMSLQRRLKARRLEDIVAGISLFRPGPVQANLVEPYVARKNGLEPYSVPLPTLDNILRRTYGILLYQEQVLELCREVAGFSLAEADEIRRAMTHDRGSEAMRKIRAAFIAGARNNGVERATAEEIYRWIEGFGRYGFSAAHAASFAYLSYASAYLAAHHPAEYFSGVLASQPMGFYSPRVLVNEARRRGLEILPPDVNLSEEAFGVEKGGKAIRCGLAYCRGLSRKALASILEERAKRRFASASDLYRRTAVGRDALCNMLRAGFFDSLGEDRSRAAAVIRKLPSKEMRPMTNAASQPELPLPHPASWWERQHNRSTAELITLPPPTTDAEREETFLLGINLRRHPLATHRQRLKELGVSLSNDILRLPHGSRVRAAGILECLQSPPTRRRPAWFLLIEDEEGLLQAMIFEAVFERYGHILYQGSSYLLEGKVEQDKRRGFSFVIETIEDLQVALTSEERSPRWWRSDYLEQEAWSPRAQSTHLEAHAHKSLHRSPVEELAGGGADLDRSFSHVRCPRLFDLVGIESGEENCSLSSPEDGTCSIQTGVL